MCPERNGETMKDTPLYLQALEEMEESSIPGLVEKCCTSRASMASGALCGTRPDGIASTLRLLCVAGPPRSSRGGLGDGTEH